MALILKNATCVTPFRVARGRCVVVEEGVIRAVADGEAAARPADEVLDLEGRYLLPGFIDVHVHGAVGRDFLDPDVCLGEAVPYLQSHGVTGVLATLASRPMPAYLRAIERAREYCQCDAARGTLLGIHCEGPFLNPEICGGANADYFCEPTVAAWHRMRDAGHGWVKMLTVSPELEGAVAAIRAACEDGVAVSAGHTDAAYEDMLEAIDSGLSLVTHTFNAMEPLHHRRPGALLATLLQQELVAQVNADGRHVHPLFMNMLYRLKGAEGVISTSDMTAEAGLPEGTYQREGRQIRSAEGIARLQDGTIVGSTRSLDEAIRVLVREAGVPLTDAARMASLNPARALRLDDRKGTIAPGKDADLVVMDSGLRVTMTISGGRIVYESPSPTGS